MKNRLVIVISVAFLSTLIAYTLIKNFFVNRFTRLEKNQQAILSQLKKINSVAKVSPTETPFATTQNLGKIREELAKIKNQVEDQNEILGLGTYEAIPTASSTVTLINYVSISDRRWPSVDVYQDKYASSRIIGQAIYGENYPFSKKENGFYYIQLNDSVYGWIHSQFVKEY